MGVRVIVRDALLAYCHVASPRKNVKNPDATPKYEVTLRLNDDDSVKACDTAIKKVVLEACKGDVAGAKRIDKQVRANADKLFLRDGDLSKLELLHGHSVVVAKNPEQPTLFGGEPEGAGILPAETFYRGCFVNAVLDIYMTENGVFATVMGLQFSKHGDKISGGSSAKATADMFPKIKVAAAAPTTDMYVEEAGFELDEEGPF